MIFISMKIKITETQLKKVINEVGGYDDHNVMASHGGNVHGILSRTISETIGILGNFVEHLQNESLSKTQIMTGVSNLSDKFYQDNKMMKDISKEIFLDDDFKQLILNYMGATSKIIKYFRLLSGFSAGIMDGKPTSLLSGFGLSMSDSELRMKISEKLMTLSDYIESLGEMFQTIMRRYQGRLDLNN